TEARSTTTPRTGSSGASSSASRVSARAGEVTASSSPEGETTATPPSRRTGISDGTLTLLLRCAGAPQRPAPAGAGAHRAGNATRTTLAPGPGPIQKSPRTVITPIPHQHAPLTSARAPPPPR